MSDREFQTLVDDHYAALYRFALGLVRRPADAGDLVQQTFWTWARKGDSLREREKVKTWLFTTLYREFLRLQRQAKREEPLPEREEAWGGEAVTPPVHGLDGQAALAALHQLEEDFRAPLALFYLEGMPYAEIAETLQLPAGTVMSRLSRGKAMLRERLLKRANPPKEGGRS